MDGTRRLAWRRASTSLRLRVGLCRHGAALRELPARKPKLQTSPFHVFRCARRLADLPALFSLWSEAPSLPDIQPASKARLYDCDLFWRLLHDYGSSLEQTGPTPRARRISRWVSLGSRGALFRNAGFSVFYSRASDHGRDPWLEWFCIDVYGTEFGKRHQPGESVVTKRAFAGRVFDQTEAVLVSVELTSGQPLKHVLFSSGEGLP